MADCKVQVDPEHFDFCNLQSLPRGFFDGIPGRPDGLTTRTGNLESSPMPDISLPRTFQALRHRNFRLFWFGQLISLSGTWMQSIAQS